MPSTSARRGSSRSGEREVPLLPFEEAGSGRGGAPARAAPGGPWSSTRYMRSPPGRRRRRSRRRPPRRGPSPPERLLRRRRRWAAHRDRRAGRSPRLRAGRGGRQDERGGRVRVVETIRKPRARIASTSSVRRRSSAYVSRPRRRRDLADLVGPRAETPGGRKCFSTSLMSSELPASPAARRTGSAIDLGVGGSGATWTPAPIALALQQVPVDGRRDHAQVGDVDAGRRDPGENARFSSRHAGSAVAARHHAVAPLERRAEGDPDAQPASGVRSTLMSPETASRPKRREAARDSQIRLRSTRAPDSTSLNG